ncbi:hypothetical protein vseg_012126 [Gypsophila vaccaria]
MAQNNVVFTNNTSKMLYPYGQHFWSGTPLTAPGRIPPGSTSQAQQRATAGGSLKFAVVYVDSEDKLPSTRKFISAFDISAPEAYGPYGTDSPQNYSMILRQDESIKEVIVRHGFIVDAIGFVVADKSGATSTTIFGGSSGTETKISLQSGEYVSHISGTYGKYTYSESNAVVATLRVHTNLKPEGYGPFGRGEYVQNPLSFSSTVGSSRVVGVFGRHSNYLDSVGVYLSQAHQLTSKASGPYGSDAPQNYSMVLGRDETIKEVIVRHGFIVDAIGFVVADKTGMTSTKLFGGNSGDETRTALKSDEYITQISGTYGKYAHSESSAVVATLRIHTNLQPAGYGPFGRGELVQNPLSFASATTGSSSVVGFFGRHSNYLESVGVYLRATSSSKAYAESGPYGPIDWNVVEVKLGMSNPRDVYVDNILGSRVEATVSDNLDATVDIYDH